MKISARRSGFIFLKKFLTNGGMQQDCRAGACSPCKILAVFYKMYLTNREMRAIIIYKKRECAGITLINVQHGSLPLDFSHKNDRRLLEKALAVVFM